jgi:hypothetical protein
MINYLSEGNENCRIRVYTLHVGKKFKPFESTNGNVRVYRLGTDTSRKNPLIRFFIYLWHYSFSFFNCLFWSPSRLIYIESMSALVPIILKKYFIRDASLFIHYHEYMGPDEYKRTSFLYHLHQMEVNNYEKAKWISHTNEDRMSLFLKDLGFEHKILPIHIMPNFPSQEWAGNEVKVQWKRNSPLRLVYAGAVDLNNMFFPEFIDWVEKQDGDCTLDILSNQDPHIIDEHVRARNARFVTIRSSVSYFDLPGVLKQYDAGLILYKGNSKNFLYNAPNKLFEYLGVGLDVWYPANLEGIIPYIRTEKHPMVIPIDFTQLDRLRVESIYDGKSNNFEPTSYFAENVYVNLRKQLMKN